MKTEFLFCDQREWKSAVQNEAKLLFLKLVKILLIYWEDVETCMTDKPVDHFLA